MAHAVFRPDGSRIRFARLASHSSRRVALLAAAVIAAFAAYCIGHTLITGGTIDPLLSVTWAVAAVVPWAACWPVLRRAALRARADGVVPLPSIAGPLALAAVASAALERCSALAFDVQHGAAFAELVLRRLPVPIGFVLAARLYMRSRAGHDVHQRAALAEAEQEPHQPADRAGEQPPPPHISTARTVIEPTFEIATRNGVIELRPCDIDWVKAAGNYLELHMDGGCHLVRRTLKGFAAATAAEPFLRIHRSVLVRRGCVAGVVRRPRGRLAIRLQDGTTHAVGRSFRADVERALGG
jgi:DNA-binding LytR/AlgR family response regulator